MTQPISDGEPYDSAVFTSKIDSYNAVLNRSPSEIIEIPWSLDNYTQCPQLPDEIQSLMIDFFIANTKSSMDFRMKICRTLVFFMSSFSVCVANGLAAEIFCVFCKDDNWGIRKMCALNIPEVSAVAGGKIKKMLVGVFKNLTVDKNLLVAQAAYFSLGKFLFYMDNLEESLIKCAEFISLSDYPQAAQLAYYLPGIYRKFIDWRPQIYDIWVNLLNNPQSSVRAKATGTFSFFLSNLNQSTCNSLVPIYKNLLRDTDIVKIEAISNLGLFICKIEPSLQQQFLGTYKRIQTYNLNWRINVKIAKNLLKIAKSVSVNLWMQEILPISLLLCEEKTDAVRIKAAKALGNIIKDIWGINNEWDSEIQMSIGRMMTKGYKIRIVLAYVAGICCGIGLFRKIFSDLCFDEVVNVRIACSIVASKYRLGKYLDILADDEEEDVKSMLKNHVSLKTNKDYVIAPCKSQDITNEFEDAYEYFEDSGNINDWVKVTKIIEEKNVFKAFS